MLLLILKALKQMGYLGLNVASVAELCVHVLCILEMQFLNRPAYV